ncbi:vomeronasal type-2 receptor 26-like [Anomaloglossus baeobatrachus]|uniref:vomeronasal type-2 receptor 26-like n=1 Tax=Anomaloglossus baeobatrachus TaxID=238106 RepID=UPI003F50A8FB
MLGQNEPGITLHVDSNEGTQRTMPHVGGHTRGEQRTKQQDDGHVGVGPTLYVESHADLSDRMRSSIDSESPVGYSRDGDIIIGGVLQILLLCHKAVQKFWVPPSTDVCTVPVFQYLQHLLAFIYAIEEINTNNDILPNISLGFRLYDSCECETLAIKSTLNILSEGQDLIPNYSCEKTSKIVAFIGHLLSSSTYTIAQITHLYGYPLISYGATDPVFNDRIRFPSVYRTIPNEYHQFQVILHLLLYFNWTWVGIISTDDDSNIKATGKLRQILGSNGICVEFLVVITIFNYVDELMKALKTSSSNVIILYITTEAFILMLQNVKFKELSSKVWISSISLNVLMDLEFKNCLSVFNGSLVITVHKEEIDGFREFLFNSIVNDKQDNYFIEFFCMIHFGFWNDLKNGKHQTNNLWVEFLKSKGTSTYIFTYTIYNAVYFLAKALHEMHTAKLLVKQYPGKGIKKLNIYIKHVHLRSTGEDIFFSPQGDVVNSFGILNWVLYPNGTELKRHVGTLSPSQQFSINTRDIVWNPNFIKIPKSVCTEICSRGKRRALQIGNLSCCFDCVPCSDGEIANLSGMENCIKCPENFWSNMNRTVCIIKTIEYLSYDDHLGSTLAAIATTFAVASTLVMITFVKHRNTAIVRANNQHLSYVLLIALTMSFICSLLFIGHPIELTCLFRQSLFLFVFSVAISSLLGKTITVIVVFNASKPGRRFKKWMGSTVSIGLTAICSFGQFLICVTWTICAPPIVEFDSKTSHDKLIVQCMDVSMFYFYLAISYIGFLALLSFIVAYSARSLPDNFNEATHITFSMIMFCSVWLSFIPTYLSAKGKYTVAVEVFAILISSAGLLVCIFTPKCYVILLKPELNDKRHIQITKQKNYKKY